MNPLDAYRFCPRCGGPLVKKEVFLLDCSSCGYHFYINPLPATAALIENAKGEILLVKRKYAPMEGYWDLPGGFMHPFETIEESVQREVQEELGVPFTMQEYIGAYEDRYEYQGIENGTICIAVRGTIPDNSDLTPADDITEYAFFSKSTILSERLAFRSMKAALEDYISRYP